MVEIHSKRRTVGGAVCAVPPRCWSLVQCRIGSRTIRNTLLSEAYGPQCGDDETFRIAGPGVGDGPITAIAHLDLELHRIESRNAIGRPGIAARVAVDLI